MNTKNIFLGLGTVVMASCFSVSCTKLDQKIYTPATDQNFWKTPEQIAAGIAPAYQALTNIPDGNINQLSEISGGAIIVPTRGNDWYDNGAWQALWLHNWKPDLGPMDGTWNDIFGGIGKANFTLSVVNALPNKPSNIDNINAELKVLRAYYYYLALDMFGNVPLVTDFNTDPSTVTNATRAQVFAFVEKEIKDNMSLLPTDVTNATYGRLTQWAAHMILAKIYLNAEVYSGSARWADCITECSAVMASGKYSLTGNYFDNFAVNNQGSTENIFVVPYDKTYIGNMNWEMQTLHYQSQATFGLSGQPWNGFCSTADYLSNYDASDTRKTQFLVGQQYGADGTALKDAQTGLNLVFDPNVTKLSDPSGPFRLAGARNVKYHPESGTSGNQSNDMVLFRLADAYMMKVEAEVRSGNVTDALELINKVRERGYGNSSHNYTAADLTLANIHAERLREFAWEGWARQDAIRFGTFGMARTPDKPADADKHLELFPIPAPQISANPNLHQNPGY